MIAPKRFNVLNALHFLIKRFNECVTFVIKSALMRFKCLGGLNSAGNVGNGVGTFGKFTRELSSCLLVLQGYVQVTGEYFYPKETHTHIYIVLFITFRVPYAVLRDVGGQFWCFLLADLSVEVHTAARAPLCPLFL